MNPVLTAVLDRPTAVLYSLIGRFGLGALFAADARCDAYGRCVTDCPASSMVPAGKGESRRPSWLTGCQGCNRCINTCPEESV